MSPFLIISLVAGIFLLAGIIAVHAGFRAPRRAERGSPADRGLDYVRLYITGAHGKRLFAWWLPASVRSNHSVVLMHGWGGNAWFMLPLAAPLQAAGLNILLIDARNHGCSDADGHSSLPRFAEDVSAAVDWLRVNRKEQAEEVSLLGHSVGAAAVLLVASRRQDIAAVISIASFAHPEWMMRRYLDRPWIPGFVVELILRYVQWVIGFRYDDIAPMYTACRAHCAVLLVHGKTDATVPVSDAFAIRDACSHNKPELYLVEDGSHGSVMKIEEHIDPVIEFLVHNRNPGTLAGRT